MRKEFATALKKQFATRLQQRLPQFRPEKGTGPFAGRLFKWSVRPGFDAFLFLMIGREEHFTIEAAWSRDGQFPAVDLDAPIKLPAPTTSPLQLGADRFRIPDLWVTGGDFWWEIIPKPSWEERMRYLDELTSGAFEERPPSPEAFAKVGALVEEAVERIVQYAVPYLAEISRRATAESKADGEDTPRPARFT